MKSLKDPQENQKDEKPEPTKDKEEVLSENSFSSSNSSQHFLGIQDFEPQELTNKPSTRKAIQKKNKNCKKIDNENFKNKKKSKKPNIKSQKPKQGQFNPQILQYYQYPPFPAYLYSQPPSYSSYSYYDYSGYVPYPPQIQYLDYRFQDNSERWGPIPSTISKETLLRRWKRMVKRCGGDIPDCCKKTKPNFEQWGEINPKSGRKDENW